MAKEQEPKLISSQECVSITFDTDDGIWLIERDVTNWLHAHAERYDFWESSDMRSEREREFVVGLTNHLVKNGPGIYKLTISRVVAKLAGSESGGTMCVLTKENKFIAYIPKDLWKLF